MVVPRASCLHVFALLALAGAAPATEPDPAAAAKALKAAGVATDGPGLLDFFRARTPSAAEQARLAAAVRRLGHDSFEVREGAGRELVAAGRKVLPFVRAALDDPDREVARRARQCADALERLPAAAVVPAARLLAASRPPGAAGVLLGYLPFAEDEGAEAALRAALESVGLREGKPDAALVAALADKHPLRRAAAAHVLGRGPAAHRRLVARLLGDADARVRFEAAAALVRGGDKSGVPALVALLGDAPLPLALRAEELLAEVAAEGAPAVALGRGRTAERRRCRSAWDAWWKREGGRLDLARWDLSRPLLGRTLICEYEGRVWEADKDGKVRWEIKGLEGPNDAQLLPGGRVLVAERNGSRVTERDRRGKVLWRHVTAGNPIACQRLGNGNTLVATFSELYELTPDARVAFRHRHAAGFRHARKLRNGHVLFVSSSGQVVELDERWKQVRAVTPAAHAAGAGDWASVEALPGGRYLVALGGAGRVVEIDHSGKITWECAAPEPVHATRLRNGHVLIACFAEHCVLEVDRSGKTLRKQPLTGRPFTVRRY